MALDEILGCLAHEAQVIAVGGLEGPSEREHQAREASIFSMCERKSRDDLGLVWTKQRHMDDIEPSY